LGLRGPSRKYGLQRVPVLKTPAPDLSSGGKENGLSDQVKTIPRGGDYGLKTPRIFPGEGKDLAESGIEKETY